MQRVLITGANRGLGLEFVKQYVANGWEVIATCRNPDDAHALRAVAGNVTVHGVDVADDGQVTALAQALGDTPLDLLINNAGTYGPRNATFGQVDFDAWLEVLKINTMAPLRVAQALAKNLRKAGNAKLIVITSKMGSITDNTSGGSYIYRSSKAGLNIVLMSMARDLADDGILCATLHPGWVRTDMGGPNGLIDAPESVSGMRKVIADLTPAQSGHFFNYDGRTIAW